LQTGVDSPQRVRISASLALFCAPVQMAKHWLAHRVPDDKKTSGWLNNRKFSTEFSRPGGATAAESIELGKAFINQWYEGRGARPVLWPFAPG
jgi:hypothetical protein